jgi:hypothetical protein
MPITPELLGQIQEYEKQGYTPDEITSGLLGSKNYLDVASQIVNYQKQGYSPIEIVSGIKSSPVKEPKPELAKGLIANAIGGKVPPGYEYNELGQVVPKQVLTQPGLDQPTPQATGVVDFISRVVPESMYRTAAGIVKLPYDLAKQVTDPIATGFQRAIGGQDTPENVGQVGKELAGNVYKTAQGLAEFAGKPLGVYGWDALKDAWLADPAGSVLGIAPLVKGVFTYAKGRGIPVQQAVEEVVKSGNVGVLMPTVGSGPPTGVVKSNVPLKGGFVAPKIETPVELSLSKKLLSEGRTLDELKKLYADNKDKAVRSEIIKAMKVVQKQPDFAERLSSEGVGQPFTNVKERSYSPVEGEPLLSGELIEPTNLTETSYKQSTSYQDPIIERSTAKVEPAYTDNLPSTEVMSPVAEQGPMPLIRRDAGFERASRPVTLESSGLQTIYEKIFGNNKPERYTKPGTPESIVDDMYDRTTSAMNKHDAFSWDRVRKGFVSGVLDVSGNVKSALEKIGGPEAKKAIMKKDLIAGADSKSNLILDDANKAIFSDMAPTDYELFNRFRTSKRMAEIGGYKPGVKGPEGIPPGDHTSWLNSLPPEKRAYLEQKQQQISAVYLDQLTQLKDAGLLGQEGFDALSKFTDYNPRKFMEYLDPVHTYDFGGRKISVSDSGIKPLKEGSEGLLFNDSKTLLAQTVVRTQARIFRNEANKALLEMAQANPQNGLVSIPEPVFKNGKRIEVKAPAGFEKLNTLVDGQKVELLMPTEMAKEWVKSDPALNRQAANMMGWLLGAKPLKMMATGWNPAFALTNIPRDLQLIWTATNEYSKHLPVATVQGLKDMVDVFPDVIHNRGRVRDYINQGGGMEFLTTQGRVGGAFSKVSDVMGWLGTKSEMLTRMALRERAIKNGATPEQATHIARSYLDFTQGGSLVKMADVGFPYLNAAVQASKSFVKAAKTNPTLFAYKLSQIGLASASIAAINHMVNPEAMKQISDRDKSFNWIFTLPEDFAYTDENGDKRYLFIKIAKDQGIRPFTAMTEALLERAHTGKIPSKQVLMAWQDFLNIVPLNKLPPVFAATLGYLGNKDFWTWEDIWKGPEVTAQEEYKANTHPAFKLIGETTGLSPERSRYSLQSLATNGNPFVGMVGGAWKMATGDLPKEVREKTAKELLATNKTVRRILSSTDPMANEYETNKEIKREDTTRRYKQTRELDQLTKDLLKEPDNDDTKRKIVNLVTTAPEYDQDRLIDRVFNQVELKDIPDKRWWLNVNTLSPESKAEVWFKRYNSSKPDKQRELVETATLIPGFLSERVMDRIIELKQGDQK